MKAENARKSRKTVCYIFVNNPHFPIVRTLKLWYNHIIKAGFQWETNRRIRRM